MSVCTASLKPGEVSGPVATITLSQLVGRQAGDLAALDRDQGMAGEALRHLGGEGVAIDGERAAGRQLVAVGGGEDQRAGAAHLLVQETDGARLPVVGAERVGAHELGKTIGLVRVGHALCAHFMDHDGDARARDLPGGLRAREPASDDVDGLRLGHGGAR